MDQKGRVGKGRALFHRTAQCPLGGSLLWHRTRVPHLRGRVAWVADGGRNDCMKEKGKCRRGGGTKCLHRRIRDELIAEVKALK